MQNVFIEKPYEFVPRVRMSWPQSIYCRLGLYRRPLRKLEGVVDYECRNLEHLRHSLSAGHSVLLTPNHPRTADPMVICHLARQARCNFYAMASWHLFNQGWFKKWVIRLMGAFSINREGLDRRAIDEAIEILKNSERPLVIFPEGTTSRTNDQLMAFMEGPAFIARTAAKRRAKFDGGQVVVHPIAIKYAFQGEIANTCGPVLDKIERKFGWRPSTDLPLVERLVKVGNCLLTLKELQYGISEPIGSHRERQSKMVDHLLQPLEEEWLGKKQSNGVAIRIKNLRMKIFPEMTKSQLDDAERKRRWRQLEDTYLAQQIDCYPENYVLECPTVDRILETVEKFEEDLTDACTVHGKLKVIMDIDEPIVVSPDRVRGVAEDPLMAKIRLRLQSKLEQLKSESRPYHPNRD